MYRRADWGPLALLSHSSQALREDPMTGDLYSIQPGQNLAAPLDNQAQASGSRPASPSPAAARRPLPTPSPDPSARQSTDSQMRASQELLAIQPASRNPYGNPQPLPAGSGDRHLVPPAGHEVDRNPFHKLPNPYDSPQNDGQPAFGGRASPLAPSSNPNERVAAPGAQLNAPSATNSPFAVSPASSPQPSIQPRTNSPTARGPRPLPSNNSLMSAAAATATSSPLPGAAPSIATANGRTPDTLTTDAVSMTVDADTDDDEDIITPIVPSEKALGKRRAVSDRGGESDRGLHVILLPCVSGMLRSDPDSWNRTAVRCYQQTRSTPFYKPQRSRMRQRRCG